MKTTKPQLYDKKKFKNKKLQGCKYLYSEFMGDVLGWVEIFRDIPGERALNAYFSAKHKHDKKIIVKRMRDEDIEELL